MKTIFKMNFSKVITLILAASVLYPVAGSSQSKNDDLQSQKTIPLDPDVRMGKLSNGFTYFIRHNTEPKSRVTLYLANKVGSVLEDEDQRGLAHFMEHMNFNGTKHFPKNELVDYLQKSGIRFGADLNAYTSFDETVYQLPLPSDKPEILKNGIQIMRDWAQDALLDSVEINKERGVVLEEKRLGKGAGERLQRQYYPLLMNNSRYASRIPIGLDEVLNNFKPEAIRRFQHDWYRPDLQALIVVGDIDVNEMERYIKAKFADLKNPPNEKARTKYSVALAGKNQFIELTDKELTGTKAEVIIKHKAGENKSFADYRRTLMHSLFNMMIAERYSELTRQADPPFLGANAGISGFLGGLDEYAASVSAEPGQLEHGFKAMWRETERVARFGFTQTELDRARKSYQSSMEIDYKEKDKTNSVNYVNEYLRYFLNNDYAPGIEMEYNLVKQDLPGITLAEVNALTQAYIKTTDRDILVLAPEKDKGKLPDEATVTGWIKQVEQEQLEPYKDEVSSKPLLAADPVPGKITGEQKNLQLGIITYTLSNGVKAVIKPTDFKNNEISFTAFSPGGTSLYPDSDYQSAASASGIIAAGGVGNYNNKELTKFLSDKQVNVSPYITERTQGVSGAATNKDMETALQLVYGYITEPRKDTAIFRGIIARSKAGLANREDDPSTVFGDTVGMIMGNYNYRRTPPSVEKLKQINLDKAYAIYKERFADASALTFTFVGSIDTTQLKPLLEKYIGGLPAIRKAEQAKDLGIHPAPGKITKTVYKGFEPKATVHLVFSNTFEYSLQNSITLNALKEVLEIRLLERLREDESGVYSPGVSAYATKLPQGRYTFSISFGCAPQNVDKLIASTLDEISKLMQNGPLQVNIDKFKAEDKASRDVRIKTNNYWLSYLNTQLQNHEDINDMFNYQHYLDKVNTASIKALAQKCFGGDNYIRLVLMPEGTKI